MIHLLAPRLRVEERLLMQAFAERGHEAALLDAQTLSLSLNVAAEAIPSVVLDRDVATGERAVLGALLAANGAVVVNRTATTRLLADRLALVRHLVLADVAVPETVVAFGEDAAIAAAQRIAKPVRIMAQQVSPWLPDAVAADDDAAEAVIEHRATLAHETLVLVQHAPVGAGWRAAVVGDEVVAVGALTAEGFGASDDAPVGIQVVVEQVVSRLGTGVYAVDVVETTAGPVVTGAGNLIEFRTLQQAGVDVAGRIAAFTLSQIDGGSSV